MIEDRFIVMHANDAMPDDPRPFEPWTVIELQGFIDRQRAGGYAHIPALAGFPGRASAVDSPP